MWANRKRGGRRVEGLPYSRRKPRSFIGAYKVLLVLNWLLSCFEIGLVGFKSGIGL